MIFLLAGIVIIGLGLFFIFGINANNVHKSFKPKEGESTEAAVKRAKTVGIVFAVAGVVLLVLTY